MEMGLRDVRRGGGTNRLSKKQSGSGLSAKLKKKGMLKKLGLSDEKLNSSLRDHNNNSKKQEMMMGYEFSCSDLEEEVSRKKTKIPKKNLKDTNGVDHASVPRKLRSAMKKKKRNLESVSKLSSASKRLNRSKNGIESLTKENEEMEAKAIVSESMMMMISKDEKEVAETLYGLAGMFNDTEKTCEREISKVESSLVVEADFTKTEESLEPAVSVISSDKTKQIDEMPLEQSDKQHNSKGLKQSSSVDVTDSPVRAIETKVATSDTDYKSNGLALWPGLSRAHVLSKPSSTKLPPWMGQAVSPPKRASGPLRIQPRKLKKCASHIYIARLIKVLQSSKGSSISITPLTLDQNELRCSEMPQRGLSHPVTTTISGFKTMVSPSKRYQNPHMLDLHRTHNPKPVQEDMTQLALNLYNPHNPQSYDFLSLSSSAGASSSSSSSPSHFPLLNSLPQYHHHQHHISAAYNTQQLSPATSSHQVQQISPYLASRFQTAYNANQQQQQQQQQLQKRLWSAQYSKPPTSVNQYSKPNLSLNLTSSSIQQSLQATSSPRYINNNNNVSHFQQQHRLMATSMSMSHHHHHNNLNRQEYHFPLIYEDTRTPLQLLCNEQS